MQLLVSLRSFSPEVGSASHEGERAILELLGIDQTTALIWRYTLKGSRYILRIRDFPYIPILGIYEFSRGGDGILRDREQFGATPRFRSADV